MHAVQYTLYFLVVLAVLIFVHELGHFLVARWNGVRVLTFAIGFGPTLFSRTSGHTEYALKLIPLGGYVKMFGEDPQEEMSPEERSVTFYGKSVWQRMAVVFAGPAFNMITAALIFCGVFLHGVPMMTADISVVTPDSAAEQGGLLKGDRITAISGHSVRGWDDIPDLVRASEGHAIPVVVERNSAVVELTVTPRAAVVQNLFGEDVHTWQMGIQPTGQMIPHREPPHIALWMGLERTWDVTSMLVQGLVKLVQGKIPANTIGGPILIAQMTGEQADQGFMNVAVFVALLSVNLGILNLLPIPVLDGGHLVFLLAEGLRGRPVNDRVREVAQQAGLFLLLTLMAFAFYNDIVRLFQGTTGLEPPAQEIPAPAPTEAPATPVAPAP
ncbi:MAG: RIP metalloprotease RseP [Nitrospirota bacterium]|nr:RIP metalloprotease RseP [Nitrospirota bacterium]